MLADRSSRTSYVSGLWHVRGGPVAALCFAGAATITMALPSLHFSVSRVFVNPERGVNIREIAPIALGTILAATTVPNFDRREQIAARNARLGQLAFSSIVLIAPLILLPLWRIVVRVRYPDQDLPSMTGLVGNVALFCCVAMTICLLLGRAASVVLTPALFVGFVVAQQASPNSFLTEHFAYNLQWHTDWPITIAVVVATLALSWRLRALPLVPRY